MTTTAPGARIAAAERAVALASILHERAAAFVALMRNAGSIAAEIADLEAQRRAALAVSGMRDPLPSATELAAEISHGQLEALRPHVPFVTSEAAERATEALTGCLREG